jgi:hypothetical protein
MSKKEKHQSDLGVLALKLDKEIARLRLLTDGRSFLDDPKQKPQIEENRRFIFQETLVLEQADRLDHDDQQLEGGPKPKAHQERPRKRTKGRARKDKPGD